MRTSLEEKIKDNYQRVRDRIYQCSIDSGRNPNDVQLVVVTKGHSLDVVKTAINTGARDLGENYVEEAQQKIEAVRDSNTIWHMIGHVQSRKAKPVCQLFSWVHSVDRLKIARRLDHFAGQIDRKIPILLECNVSGEASKYGWSTWDKDLWGDFKDAVGKILEFPNIIVKGFMTMPPYDPDPEAARLYFRRLHKLRDYISEQFPRQDWNELSMGMSIDYEVAIQEGATIVRIGTAILGPRS